MPQRYHSLLPLDSEGVRHNRPPTEAKWLQLTNVLFDDGKLKSRPAFRRVVDGIDATSLTGFEPSVPVAIGEIIHPGTAITGRESGTYTAETIRPNATGTNQDWTISGAATHHEAIDEEIPDNLATFIQAAADGDKVDIGFGNMSTSPDNIAGLVLRGRGDTSNTGRAALLKLSDANGQLGDSVHVQGGIDAAEDKFLQDFAVFAPTQGNGNAWTVSAINALEVTVELESTLTSWLGKFFPPIADGTDTDWGTFSDFDQLHERGARTENGVSVSTAGARQSFTIATSFGQTPVSIDHVKMFVSGEADFTKGLAEVKLYWVNSVGTRVDIAMQPPGWQDKDGGLTPENNWTPIISEPLTTNPETGLAWTQAEIEGSEWGMEYISGSGYTLFRAEINVVFSGYQTPTTQVTQLAIDVIGLDNKNQSSFASGDRWVMSDKESWRASGLTGSIDYTDIGSALANLSTGANFPLDHTVLFGQAWFGNGIDQLHFYPDGSNLWSTLSAKPVGRTTTAWADRLLTGWVLDSGSITPERIAYSKRNDATNWTDITAGTFDLITTPGGVQKLLPLTEDTCAAYKETGIYVLRQTGNFVAPIVPDLIDPLTGCKARMTVKRVLTPDGQPYHIFLGENPTNGFSVFAFNGSEVTDIGKEIAPKLRDDTDKSQLANAFAEIDPQTNTYWLFVSEAGDGLPKQAWVMDLNTGAWTRVEFPWHVSCAGIWNMTATSGAIAGDPTLMLGVPELLDVVYADGTSTTDDMFSAAAADVSSVRANEQFTVTVESGDFALPESVEGYSGFYRLHVWYTQNLPALFSVALSEDGGITYNTAKELGVGSDAGDNKIRHEVLEFTPLVAKRLRFKITVDPDNPLANRGSQLEEQVQIHDIAIEFVASGEQP